MPAEPETRTVPDPDDAAIRALDLAQRAATGDASSQRELVSRLLPRVRSTVHYLAGGHRDADDLVQEALVAILRGIGGYRGDASLERWADRVAVRTALKTLRRGRRRERVVALRPEPPQGTGHLEGELQRRALRRQLARLLERLDPKRRVAVVLHWVRGYTIDEIAELTDSNPHTVRDRLHVSRRKLKKWIVKDPLLRDWAAVFSDEVEAMQSPLEPLRRGPPDAEPGCEP
jgi:RNA polymerase sigma-70 factor (ECF subfamily)